MTQLKLGNTGIAVEYINTFFGLTGSIYTAETEKAVKQFQVAYNQKFYQDPNSQYTDELVFNEYSRLNDSGDVVLGRYLPILYPTGIVDIKTMTAITNTDIDYNDNHKIKQAQILLLENGFSDAYQLLEMMCEQASNLEYRYDSNKTYTPTLVNGEVRRIVTANETISGNQLIQERSDLPNSVLADFKIVGETTYTSKRYTSKFGDTISVLDATNEPISEFTILGNSIIPNEVTPVSAMYLQPLSNALLTVVGTNLFDRDIYSNVLDSLTGKSIEESNYDTSANVRFINTAVTSAVIGGWVRLECDVVVSPSAPSSPSDGDFWTSVLMPGYYWSRYSDGTGWNTTQTGWVSIGNDLYYQNSDDEPVCEQFGAYCVDTSTGVTFIKQYSPPSTINDTLRNCFINVRGLETLYVYRQLEVISGEGSNEKYILADANWNVILESSSSISNSVSGTYISEVSIPQEAYYMFYEFYNKPNSDIIFKNVGVYSQCSPMELSSITTFEPYSLANTMDEIDMISGVACLRIGHTEFIGDALEDWSITTDTENNKRFTISIQNARLSNSFCSHYPKQGTDYYVVDDNKLNIYHPSITLLTSWKQYLQTQNANNTPLTIWFEKIVESYTSVNEPNTYTIDGVKEIICDNGNLRVVYPKKESATSSSTDIYTPTTQLPIELIGVGSTLDIIVTSTNNIITSTVTIPTVTNSLGGLFSTDTSFDKINLTTGKIYRNVTKVTLTGTEDTIIVSQPSEAGDFISYSLHDVLPSRYFMDAGFCNYFKPNNDAWKGESEGYCFELGAPRNLYLSVPCKTLCVSKYADGPTKISALRNWLTALNTNNKPVIVYFRADQELVQDITPSNISQYSNYTKITNNFNAEMNAVFKLSVSIEKGSVLLKGLYDEGLVDLTDNLDTLDVTGYYDKATVASLRLYQKRFNLGQAYNDNLVYYSGVLDIPTYNHMKQTYSINEVVT